MNKEESPYDFKVLIYLNEFDDLESIKSKL